MPLAIANGETIAIGAAAALSAMAYAVFILAPAWTSYGRVWERVAASLLTIFILATLGSFFFAQKYFELLTRPARVAWTAVLKTEPKFWYFAD